jgi:fructosamine-3-kinase
MINISYIESLLQDKVIRKNVLGGGCISNTQHIITQSGKQYVLKQGGKGNMFINEANGLKELKKPDVIYVPNVIEASSDFLLMEYVRQGIPSKDFFENFGASLAQMHRYTSANFGFYEDNFIGATTQLNIPDKTEASDWNLFYLNKRLLFQFHLAERNGYTDAIFRQLFSNIEKRLPDILKGSEEAPALLHGDLWSGNFMVNESGNAVLIDPAVYYGHREAELAMTKLFGGFSSAFYSAYNNIYPLKPEWEFREGVYTLYHILNHLNLFGLGYKNQAIMLMKRYL